MKTSAISAALFSALVFTPFAYGAVMKEPVIKMNSDPRMRYEITMTIDGAPGPFERIEGSVDYKVANEHCVPMTPVTGVTIAPEKRLPIAFKRVSDNVYKGEVFIDMLKDEDYYGMGVCHWTLVGAGADLFINKTDVSPAIFLKDILAKHAVKRFYSDRLYFNTEMEMVDDGESDAARFKDPSKTYSVTLEAKESAK